MPSTDMRPGFHAAVRSAETRPSNGSSSAGTGVGAEGNSCAKRVHDEASAIAPGAAVGSQPVVICPAPAIAPLVAPHTIMRVNTAAEHKFRNVHWLMVIDRLWLIADSALSIGGGGGGFREMGQFITRT